MRRSHHFNIGAAIGGGGGENRSNPLSF